jgi:hypothetical protein
MCIENVTDEFDVIETSYDETVKDELPYLSKWQRAELSALEQEMASGVTWHPGVAHPEPCKQKPTAANLLNQVQRAVASWYVQMDNKFIDTRNKESRLGMPEINKMIPIRLAEAYPGNETVAKNASKLSAAAIFATGPDPRMSFGIYSGKAYPAPGNPSTRLFRQNMWDINTWHKPAYRNLAPTDFASGTPCAFTEMLEFAISKAAERDLLLDWISWNLQNEHQKPTWSILLYSEAKGTGKSTIGEVLAALFGPENTAPVNGIQKLTQRFAADVLSKKLVLAEEVHISSHSTDGNALKDLITNTTISVEPKYQSVVSIPQTSCFLFTTNHKPLWLEGGERRYYIIEMDHEGQAQGALNNEFVNLVGRVKRQIANGQALRDLYELLMRRIQSPKFDPKNLKFNLNATPIMRELQALSGNEGDQVLEALLQDYSVAIIPSQDFPELISHLRLRNANSLRNTLSRMGWEERRLRYQGKQHRVWCKQDVIVENKRTKNTSLALTFDERAEELGYVWFDLDYYVHASWRRLLGERLSKGKQIEKEPYAANDGGAFDNSNGNFGPFKDSTTFLRLQAITTGSRPAEDDLEWGDNTPVEALSF